MLSKYLLIMELRFNAMLYPNLDNENSDAGHVKMFTRAAGYPPLFYNNHYTKHADLVQGFSTGGSWPTNGPRKNF